jgi:hypothetical protein
MNPTPAAAAAFLASIRRSTIVSAILVRTTLHSCCADAIEGHSGYGPQADSCSATEAQAIQRYCGLSGRCDLGVAVAPFAVATIDADRRRPVDRHAAHDAALPAVIIDGLVLRRSIVPDHHIARGPSGIGPTLPTCALHKVGRLAWVLRKCRSCYRRSRS